jgi:hypothetical protein
MMEIGMKGKKDERVSRAKAHDAANHASDRIAIKIT